MKGTQWLKREIPADVIERLLKTIETVNQEAQ